jgi:hypothetical protein
MARNLVFSIKDNLKKKLSLNRKTLLLAKLHLEANSANFLCYGLFLHYLLKFYSSFRSIEGDFVKHIF